MSRRNLGGKHVLYAVMIASLLIAVGAFINLGRFNRYMADDYCLAMDLQKGGFIHAQVTNYFFFGGRFTYAALISAVELFGPATAWIGPPLCLVVWMLASFWALFEIATINRCERAVVIAGLGAILIVFAMLVAADNLAQSVYWESGYLLYTSSLVLCSIYVGVVASAVRRALTGIPAATFIIAAGVLALIAGGTNEPYMLTQSTVHALAFFVCYFAPPGSARRRALPFVIAGIVGSLIAMIIMIAAPGNRVRESFFPVSRDVLTVVGLTLRGACGFILRKFVQAPLVTVLLCAIPAYIGQRYSADKQAGLRARWRYVIFLPLVGFLLVVLCYLPGIYGAGGLVARARFIPEFVFVCTAISWAFFAGASLSAVLINRTRNVMRFEIAGLAIIAALTVMAAYRTTSHVWRLTSRASANASLWDQTDREIRVKKAQGVLDQTVPPIEMETGLGGPREELNLERDPANWKNKCVAGYYGIDSIRTP